MSNETSKSDGTHVHHRRKKTKASNTNGSIPEKPSTSRSTTQRLRSFFSRDSSKKAVETKNDTINKPITKKSSWFTRNICCKLFVLFFVTYLIMYLRPDYSIFVRNKIEDMLKRFNLTSEEFRFRPGQRLAQYRQPSMPIIIIPGIVSTGLELWQGTECATGRFRHRFWTSLEMVDNIGRDHQCWLKHLSLNLSTWYVLKLIQWFYLFLFNRKDPDSIRLRPVLGWAAADYVYAR